MGDSVMESKDTKEKNNIFHICIKTKNQAEYREKEAGGWQEGKQDDPKIQKVTEL